MSREERLRGRNTPRPPTLMQQEDDIRRAVVAHHEAGHIVTSLAMGHEIGGAWVDLRGRDGRVGGHDSVAPPWAEEPMTTDEVDPQKERYLYERLIVAAAGHLVERPLLHYLREQGLSVRPDTRNDQDQVESLARLLARDEPVAARGAIDAAMAAAEEIVTAHWAAVQALAQSLAEAGDMDGTQIMAVVAEAGGVRVTPPALPVPLVGSAVP